MDKQLKNLTNLFTQDVARASLENRLPSRDLVQLCEAAGKVLKGTAVVVEMLQVNRIVKDSDDPQEADRALNDAEEVALLNLVHAASSMLNFEISAVAERLNDEHQGACHE